MSHIQSLSVIMITKNAERTLADSLASVSGLSDEIIVIDSGSTDRTAEIATSFTDKFHVMDWPGYGQQKQRALDLATGDWVLSLDSDEVINPELAGQIQAVLQGSITGCQAYEFRQHLFFCGNELKFSCSNRFCMRLFRRDIASFSSCAVHERIELSAAKVGLLKGGFRHYSWGTLRQWVDKMNCYTSISARKKRNHGKKSGLAWAVFSGFFAFIKSYFIKLGFLDGRIGLVLSINEFISSYIKYLKVSYDGEEQE